MKAREAGTEVEIREYRDGDERAVLDLLAASLGGGPAGSRTPEFFRWKHLENPFGRSFMLVAEADGRIVGLRAFMRWEFRAGGRTVRAVRAVDTATHPAHRRGGLFSRLTLAALDAIRGEVDLVFNTPNEKSLPGYLKMGWRVVGEIPISVRVRRPLRFLRRVRGLRDPEVTGGPPPPVDAVSADEALRPAEGLSLLLDESAPSDGRLRTPRTFEYLRWRFGAAPALGYRAITEGGGERPAGIAFFRVRPRGRLWESTVSELIVRPGDGRTARRLLRKIWRAARVDHLTCSFPARTSAARAATRGGFIRAPGGMTLVVNPVAGSIEPDPKQLRSWAMSLGDLEVF